MKDDYKLAALVHSQHIADIVSEQIRRAGWDAHVEVTSYDTAVDDARRLVDHGYEAILCHGGFREAVFAAFGQLTVIIERSDIDLIKSLHKARAVTREVALTAHVSEARDFAFMENLLEMRIHPVLFASKEDLEQKVQAVMGRGIRDFVGGGGTARMVSALGGRTFLDEPQPDNICNALQRAVGLAHSVRMENIYRANIKAILGNVSEGVICLDHENSVVFRNRKVDQLLGLKPGADLTPFLDRLYLKTVLRTGTPQVERIVTINDAPLLVSVFPMKIATTGKSAVCLVQDVRSLQNINRKIGNSLSSRGLVTTYAMKDICGNSPDIARLKDNIVRYAKTDISVYVHGETGTGKELVAHALHAAGKRSSQPFVVVNCAALPDPLLESELFGHEEGAFTGAKRGGKSGLFELANGGTLFFDEIGDISPALQVRLLRVLDAGEIMRVGGDRFIPVDVRVVCASHRLLQDMVREGTFRMDLYFRLAGATLYMPPLRERLDDIPELLESLLAGHGRNHLAASTLRILHGYSWPGNVRELLTAVKSCLVLTESHAELPDAYLQDLFHSRTGLTAAAKQKGSLKQRLELCRNDIVREVLQQCNGHMGHAARELEVSYSHFRRLLN